METPKYKLHVKLQGCGSMLMDEVKNDLENVNKELNYTLNFSDGGFVTSTCKIEIDGKNVIMDSEFEGAGDEFLDKMDTLKKEIHSGEFQRSCKGDWDRYPEQSCQKIIATIEVVK